MITVQIPEKTQLQQLEAFLTTHGFERLSSEALARTMILTDGGVISGFACYEQSGSEGAVSHLFVAPGSRGCGFGDGLLRAVLNLMERCGISDFYIPAPAGLAGFMKAEEIGETAEGPTWYAPVNPPAQWFAGQLPAFFQRPCKGGRR